MNVLFYSLQHIHSVLHPNSTKLLVHPRHSKKPSPCYRRLLERATAVEFAFASVCVLLIVVSFTVTRLAVSWARMF